MAILLIMQAWLDRLSRCENKGRNFEGCVIISIEIVRAEYE